MNPSLRTPNPDPSPLGRAEALAQLAEELRGGSVGDKERAVSMLSSLTLYVEHHDAILGAGVLPSLLVSVKDERLIPQVGGWVQILTLYGIEGSKACNAKDQMQMLEPGV